MHPQVPNALTLGRIVLIPFFAWFLFFCSSPNAILIALIIFCVASFTDYLDGALARKHNIISSFGKIMDPLADKLLVLTALAGLSFGSPYQISAWVFWLILARELIVTVLREIYKKRGVIVAADKLGKLKTVTQMLGIIAALGYWSFASPGSGYILIIRIWFWIVLALTLISGANYLKPRSKTS